MTEGVGEEVTEGVGGRGDGRGEGGEEVTERVGERGD